MHQRVTTIYFRVLSHYAFKSIVLLMTNNYHVNTITSWILATKQKLSQEPWHIFIVRQPSWALSITSLFQAGLALFSVLPCKCPSCSLLGEGKGSSHKPTSNSWIWTDDGRDTEWKVRWLQRKWRLFGNVKYFPNITWDICFMRLIWMTVAPGFVFLWYMDNFISGRYDQKCYLQIYERGAWWAGGGEEFHDVRFYILKLYF